MLKYILSVLLIFVLSCNNQPSDTVTTENGTTTMKFGATSAQTFNIIPNADDSIITLTIGHIPHVKLSVVTTPPIDTVVVVPPVTGTRANLILENTFDGNPWSGFTLANQQYVTISSTNTNPKNINQVVSPDGIGKALQFILNRTDPIVSSSVRAEIQLAGTDAPLESERWYGLRYWLQKYDYDDGRESILQWHDGDGTTPPLSLQVGSGTFTIMQSFTTGNIPTDIGPTVTGRWIPIVIHVKWTTGTTGILEVWKDGKKVVSKTNVRTNSKGGSYMKIGINKWSWAPGGGSSSTTQRIFYIDDFRMGNEKATYADVAP